MLVSPYLRLPLRNLSVSVIVVLTSTSFADKEISKKNPVADQQAFETRWATLAKDTSAHMFIKMKPKEDPAVLPSKKTGGYTVVANTRSGFLPPPPILSPEDISSVVGGQRIVLRTCYKEQLKQNQEWADQLILDIAIRKSGQVNEVDISPGRVKRDVIGKCLMREVPKWQFPEFTGALEDGIQQDIMNASIPFSFGLP